MNLRGPKGKISRRLGIPLTEKMERILQRKPYPPGQHGPTRRTFGLRSVFGRQLLEKQRLRARYNVSERQMLRYFEKACRSPRPTGEVLLQQLETRLDCVIHRAGFARTVFAARQYAAHRHFLVNGRRVSIPSMSIRPGDVVELRERSRTRLLLHEEAHPPAWLDRSEFQVRLTRLPALHEIPAFVDLPMVVEHYSR